MIVDPIDLQLQQSGATVGRLRSPWGPGVLHWPAAPFPALLLLAGVTLGPHGLAILTPQTLAFLDPAAPVALALLGVLAGLSIRSARGDRGVVAVAHGQAMVTAIVVAAGMLAAAITTEVSAFPPWWMVALVLGISAATSSSLAPDSTTSSRDVPAGLDFHDELLPIIIGGLLLALVREGSPAAAVSLAAQTSIIAGLIAVAGWLLLSRASTPAEQRVFVFASFLLLGGAADYLSASALFGGLVAGVVWQRARGAVREDIRRDATYIQRSLLVLLLVLAGAHAEFSRAVLILSIAYVVFRVSGKLCGARLFARSAAARAILDTRVHLISPGVVGVAFALNVVRAGGPAFVPALSVVVAGTIASSLIAAFARSGTDEP